MTSGTLARLGAQGRWPDSEHRDLDYTKSKGTWATCQTEKTRTSARIRTQETCARLGTEGPRQYYEHRYLKTNGNLGGTKNTETLARLGTHEHG